MRALTIAGILLIALGLFSLTFQGITYRKKEKVVDLGPIEATATTRERIPLPPLFGGLALASGVVLLLAGRRRRE